MKSIFVVFRTFLSFDEGQGVHYRQVANPEINANILWLLPNSESSDTKKFLSPSLPSGLQFNKSLTLSVEIL